MIEIDWQPERGELRRYALLWCPLFCALAGALLYTRCDWPASAFAVWGAGAAVAALGLLWLPGVRLLYIGHRLLVWPLSQAVAWVLLAAVYFLLVMPIGWGMRLVKRDALARRLEPERASYWAERPAPPPAKDYFRAS